MIINNIFEIVRILNDDLATIRYLQEHRILATESICSCGRPMRLIKRLGKSDGYVFRCPKKCTQRSVRHGSFFSGSKLELKQLVMLTYFWIMDIPTNRIHSMIGMSNQSLADWQNYLYEVCSVCLCDLSEEERKIGGEGIIVEIDETLISKKPKYYRGRWYPELWLFGGTERGSGKWFGQVVLLRNRETLSDIIKKFIRPNSIIYSDQWPAYWTENYNHQMIPGFDYIHLSVNHKLFFKDPVTGVHTNKAEGWWGNIKVDMRKRRGMSLEQKINYLDFRLWLSRQDYKNTNILSIYWDLISRYYPTN